MSLKKLDNVKIYTMKNICETFKYHGGLPITITDLMYGADLTYSHTIMIVRLLELNLIKTEKNGRKVLITLTPEGKQFTDAFLKAVNLM